MRETGPLFASFFRLMERRKMIKLGMKLFSTNCLQTPDFAASVIDYVNAHDDMFLELMAVPGSFEATHAFSAKDKNVRRCGS